MYTTPVTTFISNNLQNEENKVTKMHNKVMNWFNNLCGEINTNVVLNSKHEYFESFIFMYNNYKMGSVEPMKIIYCGPHVMTDDGVIEYQEMEKFTSLWNDNCYYSYINNGLFAKSYLIIRTTMHETPSIEIILYFDKGQLDDQYHFTNIDNELKLCKDLDYDDEFDEFDEFRYMMIDEKSICNIL